MNNYIINVEIYKAGCFSKWTNLTLSSSEFLTANKISDLIREQVDSKNNCGIENIRIVGVFKL